MTRRLITYSLLSKFINCRKLFYWCYERQIRPLRRETRNLDFGSLWHKCLENRYIGKTLEQCIQDIDATYPKRAFDENQNQYYNMMVAMIRAYWEHYKDEKLKILAVEKLFEVEMINPETGANSKTFRLAGKTDGIVEDELDNKLIFEHKTASLVDSGYIERINLDLQTILYGYCIERFSGTKISGTVYNVVQKPKIKKKEKESDEEFQNRIIEKYGPTMFTREVYYNDKPKYDEVEKNVWELSQQIIDCRYREIYYPNTDYCFKWNRACDYLPICQSNNNQNIIDNMYESYDPTGELVENKENDLTLL